MPISSCAASVSKKNTLKIKNNSLTPLSDHKTKSNRTKVVQRSNSFVDVNVNVKKNEKIETTLETDKDRLCLDKRGLTSIPVIEGDNKLRLFSMQHNLIDNLKHIQGQKFPFLVFLDLYNNQIECLNHLDELETLRVLLIGKNRIKKIENLHNLQHLEVLDLHGNQITAMSGLTQLCELKVLNLAGNLIKHVGLNDLEGLRMLEELNLRRNKLKKLTGFAKVENLQKLFVSNNEIQTIEDIASLAKATRLRQMSIDNNPVSLGNDCVPFLVSYLPNLINLNSMSVTENIRKTAMTWRRTKESSNKTFKDLTLDLQIDRHREEIISHARTNWELLKTQTKCFSGTGSSGNLTKLADLSPDSDIILTSIKGAVKKVGKTKKLGKNQSQEGEIDFFKLPPILVPIINKMQKTSSVGPTIDSSSSVLTSRSDSESDESEESEKEVKNENEVKVETVKITEPKRQDNSSGHSTETSSNLSSNTSFSLSSSSDLNNRSVGGTGGAKKRNVKSAVGHVFHKKVRNRAATAKPKKLNVQIDAPIPVIPREREQGGDYLIEICGRHLNVYGQAALHFFDKSWNPSKANDVTTVNFNFANYNHVSPIFSKIKQRFPNAENFVFKETNITFIGQLNALAEMQGLTSLTIGKENNPIIEKEWKIYAVYRLSHWGLKRINDEEVTSEDIRIANEYYQSLSDIVFWTLPDELLHPLLKRLRIDVNDESEMNAKAWLMKSDPALRSVVCKEALQWKKPGGQEDVILRQKAKSYVAKTVDELCNSVKKIRLLDDRWPEVLYEIVHSTLIDYTHLEIYMKRKLQQLR